MKKFLTNHRQPQRKRANFNQNSCNQSFDGKIARGGNWLTERDRFRVFSIFYFIDRHSDIFFLMSSTTKLNGLLVQIHYLRTGGVLSRTKQSALRKFSFQPGNEFCPKHMYFSTSTKVGLHWFSLSKYSFRCRKNSVWLIVHCKKAAILYILDKKIQHV